MRSKPMRIDPFTLFRRPALLALLLSLSGAAIYPQTANAALDLLKVPSRPSALAAKGMMLAIARAGERLVAAGERGLIVYSDDQGKTWQQGSVPVSVTLTALYFVSPKTGWAAGHDGVILATGDGGQTWSKQFDGNAANTLVSGDLEAQVKQARAALDQADAKSREVAQTTLDALQASLDDVKAGAEFGPSRPLLGLWFGDASEGLAVGSFGQIFRTGDGGKTWESWSGRISNPDGFHYNNIVRFADGSLMIAGEAGKLRRSRDNGARWETLDTGYAGHLYGVLGLPGSPVLIAYGFGGNVLRSADDGKSWTPLPKLSDKPIIGGTLLPDGAVLLLTRDRRLLISRDQGQSFVRSDATPGRPVAALLPTPLTGQALAVAGIGGASLIPLATPAR